MSDPDQQKRIEKLLIDPKYQRLREAVDRDRAKRDKGSVLGRLQALGAEAEKDETAAAREDEYLARRRSIHDAGESLLADASEDTSSQREAPAGKPRDDRRRRPAAVTVYEPITRASLPRLVKLGETEANLPDFPTAGAPVPDSQMLRLPPGADDVVRACPSWLLWLFARAGGDSWKGGGGAPWPLRLFVYALLHLNVDLRDGEWHTIRFDTETVIGWLHPNGWKNIRRDWELLPAALDWMRRLAYVPVPGFGRVAMLFPSVIPSERSDPLVEFTIRIPPSAAYGDRLDWPLLIRYGAESARMFRAYLGVTAWLGRSAHAGHPITRQIGKPLYRPDGKPRRRKNGAIVRSKTHFGPNPFAGYAKPELTERDLATMMGFDPDDRRRRHEARHDFERMDDDGVIDLQRSGYRFVIFGASRDQRLRRKGAAAAAELLLTASNQDDSFTRSQLVDQATGAKRRTVVHALRDIPPDEPVSPTVLKKAAHRLKIIAI